MREKGDLKECVREEGDLGECVREEGDLGERVREEGEYKVKCMLAFFTYPTMFQVSQYHSWTNDPESPTQASKTSHLFCPN